MLHTLTCPSHIGQNLNPQTVTGVPVVADLPANLTLQAGRYNKTKNSFLWRICYHYRPLAPLALSPIVPGRTGGS